MSINKIRLLLIGLCGVVMVTPALSFSYSITDLGTLGGASSWANDINNSGQVVGYSYLSNNTIQHATLWANGSAIDVGTLGGTLSYASGINNSGQIVGTSQLGGDSRSHGFLYSQNSMYDLGTFGGADSTARGINDKGQIVGTAYDTWNQYNGSTSIGYITGENGIGLQALGSDLTPNAINSNGQITGYQTYYAHSYLYSAFNRPLISEANGNVIQILDGLGIALGVNNLGTAVGLSTGANTHATLWNNGNRIDLGTLGGTYSVARDINDDDAVVGYSLIDGNAEYHATIWKNGTAFDLNSLIDPALEWTLYDATAINSSGQIVGNGFRNGQTRAFLLTPEFAIPLPGTLSLIIAGIAILVSSVRRKTM